MSPGRRMGVLIHYSTTNYGNHLVNLATRRILERCGYEVDLIVLEGGRRRHVVSSLARLPRKIRRLGIRALLSRIAGRVRRRWLRLEDGAQAMDPDVRRLARFEEFSREHLRPVFIPVTDRAELVDRYERFAIGSDQIWNYDYGLSSWHFAAFVEGQRVVSISPSVGHDGIPNEWVASYQRWLSRFEEVGTRELQWSQSLPDWPERPRFTLLIDPTLTITREEWLTLANTDAQSKGKLLFYTLGETRPQDLTYAREVAHTHGLEMLRLSGQLQGPPWESNASDFLGMVANASCVITDSYHGAVFAFLFDRPLVLIPRHGFAGAMNSRIETLVGECHLADRVIGTLESADALIHDYSRGYDELGRLRGDFWAYLERHGLKRTALQEAGIDSGEIQ